MKTRSLGRHGPALQACQRAKRGNSPRVMAEAVRWARRGARLNAISPGLVRRARPDTKSASTIRFSRPTPRSA